MKHLFNLIESLIKVKFYGELKIKFFNGEIRSVIEEKSHDVTLFK